MGIKGLIPFLEKASSKVSLNDIRGCTVAVDTYCWLHKGVFACAEKICRGEDSDMYIQYCLKYVNMLLSWDIKPILVFDGCSLPAKANIEKRRRESRQQSKKRAAELLRIGKTEEARSQMRRCVDVTHEMALRLIQQCRLRNVDCIVAPYEADAQLAFLNKLDLAQYIITEDSDLVLFGCKKIIFKLDLTGYGLLVDSNKLYLTMGCQKEVYSFDKFRRMCILSGCDYLDSLPGIGLAKACKFILKTEEQDMWKCLKKIPQYLNMRNLVVDDEYIDNFLKADATFKHMYVYNPLIRKMERLHELSFFDTDEKYCSNAGSPLPSNHAFQLALGNLDPFSMQVLDEWNPLNEYDKDLLAHKKIIKRTGHKSIWLQNFKPQEKNKNVETGYALFFNNKNLDSVSSELVSKDLCRIAESKRNNESNILSLYQNEAELHPKSKRQCTAFDNVLKSDDLSAKAIAYFPNAHNPFAKDAASLQKTADKSPLVWNSSQIKCHSPKKYIKMTIQNNRREFKSNSLNKDQVSEVKSRFFESNVLLARNDANMRSHLNSATAATEEINCIENVMEKNLMTVELMYGKKTTSPIKSVRVKCSAEQEDFTLTGNNNAIWNYPQQFKEKAKTKTAAIFCVNNINFNSKINKSVTVSVQSRDDDQSDKAVNTDIAPKLFFKQLSQNKTTSSNIKIKSRRWGLAKSNASTIKDSSFPQNQSRLSMFGFKKIALQNK